MRTVSNVFQAIIIIALFILVTGFYGDHEPSFVEVLGNFAAYFRNAVSSI